MVQLTWPHAKTDWAPMLDEITETYEEMAREISKRETLLVVGEPSNDTWARDHGFITLVDDQGDARLLDFCFNGWGEKFESELDNAINRRIYDEGKVKGEYVDCLDFVLEGGSIESDGQGTIFTICSRGLSVCDSADVQITSKIEAMKPGMQLTSSEPMPTSFSGSSMTSPIVPRSLRSVILSCSSTSPL